MSINAPPLLPALGDDPDTFEDLGSEDAPGKASGLPPGHGVTDGSPARPRLRRMSPHSRAALTPPPTPDGDSDTIDPEDDLLLEEPAAGTPSTTMAGPPAASSPVMPITGGITADPWAAWFDRLPEDLMLAVCRVDWGRIQGRAAEIVPVAAARSGGWRHGEVVQDWIAERLGPGSYRVIPRASGARTKHPGYDSRPLEVDGLVDLEPEGGRRAVVPVPRVPAVDPLALRRLEIEAEDRRAAATIAARAEELRLRLALEEARARREAEARAAADDRQDRLAAEAARRAELEEARQEAKAIQARLIEILAKPPPPPTPVNLSGLSDLMTMQGQAMTGQMRMMNDAMEMISESQARLAEEQASAAGGNPLIDREVLIEAFRTTRTLLAERKVQRTNLAPQVPAPASSVGLAPVRRIPASPLPVLRHPVPMASAAPSAPVVSPAPAMPPAMDGVPDPASGEGPVEPALGLAPASTSATGPGSLPTTGDPVASTGVITSTPHPDLQPEPGLIQPPPSCPGLARLAAPSAARQEVRRGQVFLGHLQAIQTGEIPDDEESFEESLAILPATVAAALGTGSVERVAESLRPALESDPDLAQWFNDGDGVVVWLLAYAERLYAELATESDDDKAPAAHPTEDGVP